ncbi:unnamed protein product [Rotaria sp. Silwood1]|nr:unnamed protein product [Rotaria sp. Silwood1]
MTTAYFSDKHAHRSMFILSWLVISMTGFVILIMAQNLNVKYFDVFLATGGILPCVATCIMFPSCNISPYTKRATALAFMLSIGSIGGVISGQLYTSQDAPHFILGHAINLGFCTLSLIALTIILIGLHMENRQRDRLYGSIGSTTMQSFTNKDQMITDEAAQGIIFEGTKLSKPYEAEWLAEQLRAVKHFGNTVEAEMHTKLPPIISQTCVYLYTKESFLYKLINSVLRNPETITCEQLKTLGPFSWLLCTYLNQLNTRNNLIVYRGVTLTDQQRQEYIKKEGERICFTSFTSTSENQELAEQFGNTLFVIDLGKHADFYGVNVSLLSDFPEEEEFLINTVATFKFVKYEFDNVKKKYFSSQNTLLNSL